MVWRIHFTAADLARTRISPIPGPLAETVMALSLLRCPLQPRTLFSEWRSQVGGQLTAPMKPLMTLVPPGTKGVDLYASVGQAPTIEQGLGALLATPREHLLVEMEFFDRLHRLPASAWATAETGSDARLRLADAAHATYTALIEPYWTRIQAHLLAEQASYSRILMRGGVERLLTTLQAQRIRWRPPVLELLIPGYADVELAGRGLRLVPSLFVGNVPSLHTDLNDDKAAPWLIFPARYDLAIGSRLWDTSRPAGTALAALVGRTRAAVLGSIADGCTTTELAGRVGISLAAASQHTAVLRDAGLITTRRQGSAVLHAVTPLGADLLQAGTPAIDGRQAVGLAD
jgi:DNA-binding transcriptional ArsR family regulator